jgi:uncharacterized protein (DUF2249 family)
MDAARANSYEELDVRGVEAPTHILKILQRVGQLPPGKGLRARLDNNPMQLYDLLQQRGFFLHANKTADGTFLATVEQNPRGH